MAKPSSGGWELPKGFLHMNDILNGEAAVGSFVNVAGLVRDVQLPIKSKGTDYKMRMSLIDKSVDGNGSELSIHIFAAEAEMPTVSLSDVVLVHGAKVQRYNDEFSLIVNMNTSIYVCPAKTIPPLPLKTPPPLRPCGLNKRCRVRMQPTENDASFAACLFHAVDKSQWPTIVDFQQQTAQTLNVRDKESSLGDLVAGYINEPKPKFYDILVNVVYISTRPGGEGFDSRVPLWVTDYTEHPQFYDFPLPDDLEDLEADAVVRGQPGDPMGYLTKYSGHSSRPNGKNNKKDKGKTRQWPGPFGRRCMLISCYEPHAAYIRESVRPGDWVRLRNVRVAMGKNGRNLEGFMTDDFKKGSPVRVDRIDMAGMELEDMSEWHRKALRRKQKYQKYLATLKKKSNKRKAAAISAAGGVSAEGKPINSKQRRKEMRAREANGGGGGSGSGGDGGDRQPKQEQQKKSTSQWVVSEHTDQAVTPLATVLEPRYFKLQDDKEVVLPFANLNFRARVRVVDYLPERLQDFAVSRKRSEFEILQQSDGNESGASSSGSSDEDDNDDDDDEQDGTLNRYVGETVWEWRFALLLEDASDQAAPAAPPATNGQGSAPPTPRRIWAVVDNSAAQLLTGLDACDLRHDGKTLKALKAKMFLLWGNLDEAKQKAREAAREAKDAAAQRAAEAKKAEAAAAEREKQRQQQLEQKRRQKEEKARQELERRQKAAADGLSRYPVPAPDSSDDEGAEDEVMEEAAEEEKGKSKDIEMADAPVQQPKPPVVSNVPFVCCLRQYGVKVQTAGAGKKKTTTWKQMFALFGTQIKG